MLKISLQNKIKEILSNKVKFAYIFGSANNDYFNNKSDIDIAVWLISFPYPIESIIDLKYEIEQGIDFEHDIDLLILNNADIIITNQVITTGKLIIDKDNNFTDRFVASRLSMYFDFKLYRKNLEENLKNKIL